MFWSSRSLSHLYFFSLESPFSVSGDEGCLRWTSCTTTLCNVPPVSHSRDKGERCLLCSRILKYVKLDFDWCIPLDWPQSLSVDRLLALLLGLRYRRRSIRASSWSSNLALVHWCLSWIDFDVAGRYHLYFLTLSLVRTIFCYTRILFMQTTT